MMRRHGTGDRRWFWRAVRGSTFPRDPIRRRRSRRSSPNTAIPRSGNRSSSPSQRRLAPVPRPADSPGAFPVVSVRLLGGVVMAVVEREQLYIGGEWVDPAGQNRITVIEAATEQPFGSVPEG